MKFEKLVGMTEEDAEKLVQEEGLRMRVIRRNSMFQIVTRDHRTDRLNVYVDDGIVSEISGLG